MSNTLEVLTSNKYDLEDLLREEQDLFENLLINQPNNRPKIADTLDRIEAISQRISTLDHQISLLPEQIERGPDDQGSEENSDHGEGEDEGEGENEDDLPALEPVNVVPNNIVPNNVANLLQINNNNLLLQNLANILAAGGGPGANMNMNDFLVNHLNNHNNNHFNNLQFLMNQQVVVDNEIIEDGEREGAEAEGEGEGDSDDEIDGEGEIGLGASVVFTLPLNGGNMVNIVDAIQQMMGVLAQNQGDREYEMFSNLENVNVPCKPEVIAKIIPTKYSDIEQKYKEERNIECSICLSEYEKDDLVTLLKCDHIYHIDCINNWIKNNSKCPVCKYDLNQIDIHESA